MLPAGLGLTPPMGWSSWNVFAAGIDEDKIMTSIDAMAELVSAGYQYVNVDDNWMEPHRDVNGSLVIRKDKFPNGMKYLADHAHSKGLKFGIYSAHGSRTCCGNAASGGDDPHWQQ
jgi:alpha-galactosidase